MITASVVSHGHGALVGALAAQLLACPEIGQLIVTVNIPETINLPVDQRVSVRTNLVPKGFGANHNAAFGDCRGAHFCVLNPDLEIGESPFAELLGCLDYSGAALAAPAILESRGDVADSMRHFPTPAALVRKALGRGDGRIETPAGQRIIVPDWVAGMFMLFRTSAFEAVGGFDEGFFMYYEDVDICARLWKGGQSVIGCPRARVVHHARRASRRDLRHARWHVASMLRFWRKNLGRFPAAGTIAARATGAAQPSTPSGGANATPKGA